MPNPNGHGVIRNPFYNPPAHKQRGGGKEPMKGGQSSSRAPNQPSNYGGRSAEDDWRQRQTRDPNTRV